MIPSRLCWFPAFRIPSLLLVFLFTLLIQFINNSFNVCCITATQFHLHTTVSICFYITHLWIVWAGLLHAERQCLLRVFFLWPSSKCNNISIVETHFKSLLVAHVIGQSKACGSPKVKGRGNLLLHQEAIARVLDVLVGVERQRSPVDTGSIFIFSS